MIKLEDDSDFPVGRPYFWHAYCSTCQKSYYPHIPGQWTCLLCKERVWQHPKDPESKRCAVCKCDVAAIVMVNGKKIRNPMVLNAHMCKRCGRVVCDRDYMATAVNLEEYGYHEPQQVCKACIKDIDELKKAPEEEDLGTLHEADEVVADTLEQALCNPHWVPKCNRCNITFGAPPKKWLCTSCQLPVWQPLEAADSAHCWLCNAPQPKMRCYRCGQLVCFPCGAYGQPLPEVGWDDGMMLTCCKVCYNGRSVAPRTGDVKPEPSPVCRAKCPQCQQTFGAPPEQWLSPCHKKKSWMSIGEGGAKNCDVCNVPITAATADNCARCGNAVCVACAQYREPVPERGFDKKEGHTVCKRCHDPIAVLLPDATDFPHWPAECPRCRRKWPTPPERWRCPFQCGPVWQSPEHICSKGCWACGKKVGANGLNCRKCGRLVCSGCGEGRAEVPERGFTRGVMYPVCVKCVPPVAAAATGAAGAKAAGAKPK